MDRRNFLRMIPGIIVLPKVIEDLAPEETGIIGCTGPTGPTVFQPLAASAFCIPNYPMLSMQVDHWGDFMPVDKKFITGVDQAVGRDFSVKMIATIFEVPLHMLGFDENGKLIKPRMQVKFDPKRLPQ